MYLKGLRDDVLRRRDGASCGSSPAALGVGAKLVAPWLTTSTPTVPVQVRASLRDDAHTLARLVREFGLKLPHVFMAAEGRGEVRAGRAGPRTHRGHRHRPVRERLRAAPGSTTC